MTDPGRILLVANPSEIHVGGHFLKAAKTLEWQVLTCNVEEAYDGNFLLKRIHWIFNHHRPNRLVLFSQEVHAVCVTEKPRYLLATGIAPLESSALNAIGQMGIRRLNYLTDDPWNPVHQSPWFMRALPFYDHIFTVRRSNLEDLKAVGSKKISYLPFAFSPEMHYPEETTDALEKRRFETDIVFVGGADRDRRVYAEALARNGFKIKLYGGYWDHYRHLREYYFGHADPRQMRLAIGNAKVALCLVRRANRDGHSMRSFEIPAIGTCMLTEDTQEHRDLFGAEGESVCYFRSADEMVKKAKFLVEHPFERKRLGQAAQGRILNGGHTYRDRLIQMLAMDQS